MFLSLELAEFVSQLTYDKIPDDVIEMQKISVLDSIGIILGASSLGAGCREFVEYAIEASEGGKGKCTILGYGHKEIPTVWAAFANASMVHSLDFGDTYTPGTIHSNASTFPAALAVAESLGDVDGKQFLTALIAGSEIACRIAYGINEDLLKKGWYMPPIITGLGATAAVCKLLDLSPDQILSAWSFYMCQETCSAELVNNAKTPIRSVREAFAAKAAVTSAFLAKKNLIGFEEPFEGKLGFYHAYAQGNYSPERVLDGLGTKFESKILSFKVWPSCMGTHPNIDAVLQLKKEHNIIPEEIERIHVEVSVLNEMLLVPKELRKKPDNSITAKFSIPYTSSVALIKENVTLNDFSDDAIRDPEVLALADKFTYTVNKDWDKSKFLYSNITVFTKNGKEYSKMITEAYGTYENPASKEDIIRKMITCAQNSVTLVSLKNLKTVAEKIDILDSLDNISELFSLLA